MEEQEKDTFKNLFIRALNLFIARFLKPGWLLLIFFIWLLFKNWSSIILFLSNWGIPEYSLIKEYLSVLLSFPVAILILGLIFLLRLHTSIKIFLENSYLKGAGGIEVAQKKQEQTDIATVVDQDLTSEDETININQLNQFRLLDAILVVHTKDSLHWFYLQPGRGASFDSYLTSYNLPLSITNPIVEKNSVINALVRNNLLEKNDDFYKVTTFGEGYLKYLGVVS